MKEDEFSGNYTEIAEVFFNDNSQVIDAEADVTVRTYTYKLVTVDSVCGQAESAPHTSIHVSPSAGINPGEVQLDWNHYIGIETIGYRVYKWINNDTVLVEAIAKAATSAMKYTIKDHVEGTQYRIGAVLPAKVNEKSILKSDSGPYSQALSNIAEAEVTSNNELEFHVEVYPNPATDKLFVGGNFGENANIEVFSIAGKLVLTQLTSDKVTEIDISVLDSGEFLLRIIDGDIIKEREFIKK